MFCSLSCRECGCGEGDSGCAECGCCRICARENVDNSELAILGPSGAGDLAGMMRLDLIFGGEQYFSCSHSINVHQKLEELMVSTEIFSKTEKIVI